MNIEGFRHDEETLLAVQVRYIHDPDSLDREERDFFYIASIVVRGAIRTKYFTERQDALGWVNDQVPKMLSRFDTSQPEA